jgi:hypothetical protein
MVNISLDAAWEYYEKVSAGTFITSTAIIFLVAVIITSYKIVSTARMNPV